MVPTRGFSGKQRALSTAKPLLTLFILSERFNGTYGGAVDNFDFMYFPLHKKTWRRHKLLL